ncbi:MAG: hypothetical protein U0L91_03025 [Gemmiger sp.]|uniref:hypothetical protein n=1 Tax=Gemmiger sp. TaxID=2049027 RepID=UPI002E77F011|nr:hypothetical protein [Gemmiger sp.]MEE0800235.1 hypothetical protein [Gemmiger sp.]
MTQRRQSLFRSGRVLLFLLIGAGLLWLAQRILTPTWNYPEQDENLTRNFRSFADLEEDSVQAIFLGTSHAEYGISPMRIYDTAGLVTYNLGAVLQPPVEAYYELKWAFRMQSPSVVMLDASSLFLEDFSTLAARQKDQLEPAYRYFLDTLPLCDIKWEMALELTRAADAGKDSFSILMQNLFPLFRYHDRWKELQQADFTEVFGSRHSFSRGYFMLSSWVDSGYDSASANAMAETLRQDDTAWKVWYDDGVYGEWSEEDQRYRPAISEEAIDYLCRIRELCDANGAELILFKVPCVTDPVQYSPSWTTARSREAQRAAALAGVAFWDMVYDVDTGIDWAHDSIDGGAHLNLRGAEKVSDCLAQFLIDRRNLQPRQDAAADLDLVPYRQAAAAAHLQLEYDLSEYLRRIRQWDGSVTVLMAASDDMATGLQEEDIQALCSLGLESDFARMEYNDAFLAVVEDGAVRYEELSNRRTTHRTQLPDGSEAVLTSSGYLSGSEAVLRVDGTDYAVGGRGLNLVVYDNLSGLVLDSVVFDTWDTGSHGCTHSAQRNDLLRSYEQYLIESQD